MDVYLTITLLLLLLKHRGRKKGALEGFNVVMDTTKFRSVPEQTQNIGLHMN